MWQFIRKCTLMWKSIINFCNFILKNHTARWVTGISYCDSLVRFFFSLQNVFDIEGFSTTVTLTLIKSYFHQFGSAHQNTHLVKRTTFGLSKLLQHIQLYLKQKKENCAPISCQYSPVVYTDIKRKSWSKIQTQTGKFVLLKAGSGKHCM